MSDKTAQQVALITGASSGIGAATAEAFARAGWAVAGVARRADLLSALAERVTAAGGTITTLTADVTIPADRDRIVSETAARFGRIDVLVNNAGRGSFASTLHQDEADVRYVFELNVMAPVLLTQRALPELLKTRGMIINIASVAGRIGLAALNIYNATKFALIGWSEATRRELGAQGVRVCIVDPGPVATEFESAIGGKEPSEYPTPRGLPVKVVARRIVNLTRHPRREIVVPRIYRGAIALNRVAPGVIDWALARGRSRERRAQERQGARDSAMPVESARH